MKPSDYFALALRVLGAWTLLSSAHSLVLFLLLPRIAPPLAGNAFFQERGATWMLDFLLYGLVGLYLLRGAPHLVRLAYPSDEKEI